MRGVRRRKTESRGDLGNALTVDAHGADLFRSAIRCRLALLAGSVECVAQLALAIRVLEACARGRLGCCRTLARALGADTLALISRCVGARAAIWTARGQQARIHSGSCLERKRCAQCGWRDIARSS